MKTDGRKELLEMAVLGCAAQSANIARLCANFTEELACIGKRGTRGKQSKRRSQAPQAVGKGTQGDRAGAAQAMGAHSGTQSTDGTGAQKKWQIIARQSALNF